MRDNKIIIELQQRTAPINTFPEKVSIVNDDVFIIEDSEDSFNKKKVKKVNLSGGTGSTISGSGSIEFCSAEIVLAQNETYELTHPSLAGKETEYVLNIEEWKDSISGINTPNLISSIGSDSENYEPIHIGENYTADKFIVDTAGSNSVSAKGRFVDIQDGNIFNILQYDNINSRILIQGDWTNLLKSGDKIVTYGAAISTNNSTWTLTTDSILDSNNTWCVVSVAATSESPTTSFAVKGKSLTLKSNGDLSKVYEGEKINLSVNTINQEFNIIAINNNGANVNDVTLIPNGIVEQGIYDVNNISAMTVDNNEGIKFCSDLNNNNKLLIHGTEIVSVGSFVESSSNGNNGAKHTVTVVNAIQSINGAKFNQCWSFDGNGDYLSILSHSDWTFGVTPFTIEFQIFITSNPSSYQFVLGQAYNTAYQQKWFIILFPDGKLWFGRAGGANILSMNMSLLLNSYNHIEISRDANNILRIFLNGNLDANSSGYSVNFNADNALYIGDDRDSAARAYFAGRLEEITILKGEAKHTANFTPPVRPYFNNKSIGYYTTISDNAVDITSWNDINSCSAIDTLSADDIFYSICFEANKSPFQIFINTPNIKWRNIVRNNNGIWQYNESGSSKITNPTELWSNAPINNIQSALSKTCSIIYHIDEFDAGNGYIFFESSQGDIINKFTINDYIFVKGAINTANNEEYQITAIVYIAGRTRLSVSGNLNMISEIASSAVIAPNQMIDDDGGAQGLNKIPDAEYPNITEKTNFWLSKTLNATGYNSPSISSIIANYDGNGYYQKADVGEGRDYEVWHSSPTSMTIKKLSTGMQNIKFAVGVNKKNTLETTTKTNNYIVTQHDEIIYADGANNPVDITLNLTAVNGEVHTIAAKNITNQVRLIGTINGQNNHIFTTQYEAITVVYNLAMATWIKI